MDFTEQIQDLLTRHVYGKYDPSIGSDKEREEYNSLNSRHGAYGGTSSYYGPKGDGPGSYVKTGYRYATTQSPGGRGSNRKEISIYTWMPDPKPTPAPAPAPAPPPAPAAAPQATLKVQAPSTPQVSTNQSADQVAALQKALAEATASFQSQMGQQTQSYQNQLSTYQTQAQQQLAAYQAQAQEQYQQQQQQFQTFQQQSQAQLAAAQQQAEESQRQMMIGLAQRDRAPAEVKMAQSGAAQQGLTRRGTTGYFGRQGLRIGSLNVPTPGLTISTDAAGRAASGSFM